MVIVTLANCPPSLRGDLTKWLQEVNTGVYVGKVSARVRDELWRRVCENAKTGNATMVYSANNEQGMKFRIHNSSWVPIDFDGLTLLMRPSHKSGREESEIRKGFSNAAKIQKAKQMQKLKANKNFLPKSYLVVDLETTGLSAAEDEIIEIGAIRVIDQVAEASFQALIRPARALPVAITSLTGITDLMLKQEGKSLADVLPGFLDFASDLPVVSHNADFDFAFLRSACKNCGLPLFSNRCINTLIIAKKMIHDAPDYKLATLLKHFGIKAISKHRAMEDCLALKELYSKLIEFELEAN